MGMGLWREELAGWLGGRGAGGGQGRCLQQARPAAQRHAWGGRGTSARAVASARDVPAGGAGAAQVVLFVAGRGIATAAALLESSHDLPNLALELRRDVRVYYQVRREAVVPL
jgi:hypothetical protein